MSFCSKFKSLLFFFLQICTFYIYKSYYKFRIIICFFLRICWLMNQNLWILSARFKHLLRIWVFFQIKSKNVSLFLQIVIIWVVLKISGLISLNFLIFISWICNFIKSESLIARSLISQKLSKNSNSQSHNCEFSCTKFANF